MPSPSEKYALLISDHRSDTIAETLGKGVRLRRVTEAACSPFEYTRAIVMAHVRSRYITYRIHGRRLHNAVELFLIDDGKETPHLRAQLEARGHRVTTRAFPTTTHEQRTLLLQAALADVVLPARGRDVDHGILAGSPLGGPVVVAYTSAAAHRRIRASCVRDAALPTLSGGALNVLGTVRANCVSLFAEGASLDPFFRREGHVDVQSVVLYGGGAEAAGGDEHGDGGDEVEAAGSVAGERESGGGGSAARKARERERKRAYQARLKVKKRSEGAVVGGGGGEREDGGEAREEVTGGGRAMLWERLEGFLATHPEWFE